MWPACSEMISPHHSDLKSLAFQQVVARFRDVVAPADEASSGSNRVAPFGFPKGATMDAKARGSRWAMCTGDENGRG